MIIKKYQGKNESEATELAKKELGESVVIMNVRTFKPKGLKGFFQGSKVEVTVALEEESERPQPKPPTMTALEQLAKKQQEINEKRKHEETAARMVKPARVVMPPTEAPVHIDIKADDGETVNILPANKQESLEEKLDSLETLLRGKLEDGGAQCAGR